MSSLRFSLFRALLPLVVALCLFAPANAVEVTLVSPPDGAVVNDTSVSFTCSATDPDGLSSATLYIGNEPQTVTFSGSDQTDDAQITADNPDTNSGEGTAINVDGLTPHAHGVIKFLNVFSNDGGPIPSGSSIVSATLEVNCTNLGNTMKLYRLTKDWSEDTVTWNFPWTTPGGAESDHAEFEVSGDCSAVGWRSIDITYFVQEWSSGAANYGIVLTDNGGTDGVDFESSEGTNPPVLRVSYQTDWQVYGAQSMSGQSDTVTFGPFLLSDQTSYVWNCLVEGASGSNWAPADFHFTVDTRIPPNEPVLVGPADGATGISTSPTLEVTVSDPDPGDLLDVTFYGRGGSGEEFTIVALPDTQKYVLDLNYSLDLFSVQTQWIANNIDDLNIVFVTQEGDIADLASDTVQYDRVRYSMSQIDPGLADLSNPTLPDPLVPYGVLPGNHDTPTTLYNQYFPYTHYESRNLPWYGGHYPETGNDNNYQLFSAGGEDYIIVHLQYGPTSAVFDWANGVLEANSDRKAIITTHDYMETNGLRSTNGTNIWNNVVVPSENVYFVLCGHNHDEATRTDLTPDGRQVHQLLADYQERPNGGDGWLRIMRFVPAEDKVYVETYSPYLDQYETDSNSQFTLDFAMSGFSEIGTVPGVSSGSNASIVWPGLSPLSVHEWYVNVTDTTGKTRVGPVWQFTTETDDFTPPTISGVGAFDITDNSARIVWTTDEVADSVVDYGLSTDYGSQASDLALVTSHSVTLTELSPITTYHYRVSSKDASGNVAYSEDCTFTTLKVNHPPVADDQWVTTPEDTPIAITLTAMDEDIGETLTYVIVDGPACGLLTGDPPIVTYTPNPNYSGSDSFTFKANDGLADSNIAMVTITVNPVNDAPVAQDDACECEQDASINVLVPGVLGNDSDVDGDSLTAVLAVGPSHGTLDFSSDGSFTYTPDAGYWGTDSFTYQAYDGNAYSDTATVTITVTEVSYDAYVIQDAIVTLGVVGGNGIAGTIALGDGLVQTFAESPNGTAGMASLEVEYLLHTDAIPGLVTTLELHLEATWTNLDAEDPLIVFISNGGVWQDITDDIADGLFAASDPQGYIDIDGNIRVRFTDTAPIKKESKDTLTIDLLYADVETGPPNNPPVADDQEATTDEDTPVTITLTASDPDGDPLTYSVISAPGNGSLSGTAPDLTYTPNADFNGSDSFTFTANDGHSDSNIATVTITVNPVNDSPVAADDTYSVDINTTLIVEAPGVLGNDSDVDGDMLSAAVVNDPLNGNLTLNSDGSFSYTPDLNFIGTDSFTYSVNDGNVDSNLATVTITVNEPNNPPVANNDAAETGEDTAVVIDVLANDTDADEDELTVISVTQPTDGIVVINGGNTVTYTPDPDFNGTDSFSYTVSDGRGGEDTAQVTVIVSSVNDAPLASFTYTCDGLSCLFDASGSSDPDGSITGYDWNFGDGSTDSGVTVGHTYDSAGTYTVVLTVYDNERATDTFSQEVTVSEAGNTIHVESIVMGLVPAGKNTKAEASVLIWDQSEQPQAGATVIGDWFFEGSLIQSGASMVTGADGIAVVTSVPLKAKSGETFTFVVTDVSLSGYEYDPGSNVVTDGSVTVP